MHNDMKRMDEIIQKAREAKELTQSVLAEQIEVSLRTVIAIENGKRNPTYEVLYRLIDALNIPADLIFHPDDVANTAEQEQFFREFHAANEQAQRVIMASARGILQELRGHKD